MSPAHRFVNRMPVCWHLCLVPHALPRRVVAPGQQGVHCGGYRLVGEGVRLRDGGGAGVPQGAPWSRALSAVFSQGHFLQLRSRRRDNSDLAQGRGLCGAGRGERIRITRQSRYKQKQTNAFLSIDCHVALQRPAARCSVMWHRVRSSPS